MNLESELAEKYTLGSIGDREVYEHISLLLLEWSKEMDFEICGTGIGGEDFSIDFGIVVGEDKQLPEKVANLFFNDVDFRYNVTMSEEDTYKHLKERCFRFVLEPKKVNYDTERRY